MSPKAPPQNHELRLRITAQLDADLTRTAIAEGNPLSAVVRRLLVTGLARERKVADAEPAAQTKG